MFQKFIIENESNIFNQLENSVEFENINNGRKGTNIVDYKNNLIPIIRTTTIYNNPSQKFKTIHYNIINKIKKMVNIENIEFNNGLIEIYDSNYYKMSYHSDQSLDLEEESYICIFSCYDNPINQRTLNIKSKITNERSNIELENNSLVLFSVKTNSNYLHKIVLNKKEPNNRWLGITFRMSKTYIYFINEIPYFININEIPYFININEIPYFYNKNKILRIANEDEKKQFYKLRGEENKSTNFYYPEIDYTISFGDTQQVIK